MHAYFRSPSAVRLTLTCFIAICAAMACVPSGHAQASLSKHERKMHKKLMKYPEGSYLHLVLHASSDNYGALGSVSDASFTFKSADSNAVSTYSYNDLVRVKTDREPIGQGSEREHRYIRPRTLIIAGVLAACAGVAAAEVR